MKLIVGLGNPGREYVRTRHNIGFEAIDALAVKLGLIAKESDFDGNARANFEGLALDGPAMLASGRQERVLLLKPLTYMNLSGRSVQSALAFYQTPVEDLIVVLDDIALPAGKIRLRAGGSSGGHNGLRDIERALGSTQYARLRIGVDAPPRGADQKDYVLGRFSQEQRQAADFALGRAAEALIVWMDSGIASAMNRFNAEEKNEKAAEADRKPGV